MSEKLQGLSDVSLRALLRQEVATKKEISYITLRLQAIRKDRHVWGIRYEIESLEKQLTRHLARLNKINAIFVKHGHRLED